MSRIDYFTQMKLELVLLDSEIVDNEYNILLMIMFFPWLVNDDNLRDSFSKLLTIHKENCNSIKNIVDYIKHLDETETPFFYTDLIDEFEFVDANMNLQNEYYDNMLSYIDYSSDFSNPWADIASFCIDYIEKDDEIFDQVQVNQSLIKSIHEERRS